MNHVDEAAGTSNSRAIDVPPEPDRWFERPPRLQSVSPGVREASVRFRQVHTCVQPTILTMWTQVVFLAGRKPGNSVWRRLRGAKGSSRRRRDCPAHARDLQPSGFTGAGSRYAGSADVRQDHTCAPRAAGQQLIPPRRPPRSSTRSSRSGAAWSGRPSPSGRTQDSRVRDLCARARG